jgi:hypothetical protein
VNFPDPLDKIFFIREFQRLAMLGAALPLTCAKDNGILYTAVNGEDEIYLFCLECESKLFPGSELISKIVAVVNEHNILKGSYITDERE